MATVADSRFDLEAEIHDLAARRDINDAVQRYMRGLDRLDADLQRSAFHRDAVIDCGLMKGGVDEFVTFAQGLLAGMDATHHLLGQVRIELNGETALGECYFQAWHRTVGEDDGVRDLFIAGRYVDEYACRDGEWRISARTLVTDWVKDDPGSLDFFVANPSAPRGARGGADFSQTRSSPPGKT
ncbi:nuclear transport factor 2 family protein [Novosphingobium album (ex Hu et al. 2023)]|uniref:Nuclear transport factor 2 family protein n=1 Tax=Novosphingobium album (ex Hu et al. 2023) TaxID=2930093 RepID=A0ABT0B103_9SPHN|nr:nuclear transport factor 2 family protein [Novosphingobium album (ex Hu et al. 2023)]MCJ2178747.1 nuclear transport factor 2 family protein [Novosphingobium album (ex Hu et al. 2023)]